MDSVEAPVTPRTPSTQIVKNDLISTEIKKELEDLKKMVKSYQTFSSWNRIP